MQWIRQTWAVVESVGRWVVVWVVVVITGATVSKVLGYVIGGRVLGGGVGRVGAGPGFTIGLIGWGADGMVRIWTWTLGRISSTKRLRAEVSNSWPTGRSDVPSVPSLLVTPVLTVSPHWIVHSSLLLWLHHRSDLLLHLIVLKAKALKIQNNFQLSTCDRTHGTKAAKMSSSLMVWLQWTVCRINFEELIGSQKCEVIREEVNFVKWVTGGRKCKQGGRAKGRSRRDGWAGASPKKNGSAVGTRYRMVSRHDKREELLTLGVHFYNHHRGANVGKS